MSNSNYSSKWTHLVRDQIRRGKHVILHGNISDLAMMNGTFLTVPFVIDSVLGEEGYTVRSSFNIVDGLQFQSTDGRPRFETALREILAGRSPVSSSPSGTANPPAAQGGYRPPGAPRQPDPPSPDPTNAQGPALTNQAPYLPSWDQALPALRQVFTHPEMDPCSVVFQFADKLVGADGNAQEADRQLLVQLSRLISESHSHRTGSMAGRRNAIILVLNTIGQLPAWVYRDSPFVSIVPVQKPEPEGRRAYFQMYSVGFFGQSTHPAPEATVTLFEDLTDGLTYWDLEALRLTSHHQRLSLDRLRNLVDFFKHGRREDPWEQLDHNKIANAQQSLRSEVIGQEVAIDAVTRMIKNARVGIGLSSGASLYSRPKGIFFFVGPTGVGKTELAKQMAKLIFGDEGAFIRFDMSEYAQEHAAERLTGAPPSYVGYEAGGQLTNAVKQKPFSLILFDEIEKAHPRILDKFLQILDDGRLTDGLGETVSFAKTVLIFTSNQGSTIRHRDGRVERAVTPDMTYSQVQDHYTQAVRNYFQADLGRPEILNRFGNNIVVFDILRPENIEAILQKFLRKLQESAREKHRLTLHFDQAVIDLLIQEAQQTENILNGGRGIRNVVEATLVPAVNDVVFTLSPNPGATISLSVQDDKIIGNITP